MKISKFLFLLTALTWMSAGATRSAELTTNTPCRACCLSSEALGKPTDKSLYQVESRWATDTGKEMKLEALSGRPQVLVMFFANCTYACPILVSDLQRIEASLPPEIRTRVGFTLVSFDSQRDTSAALAEYRRSRQLTAENWTLLHGQPDDVLELAALLGVRYKEDAYGQFMHSNVITLLNARGEIVFQQTGLNSDPQEMVRRIEQLTN
jgi:protein SCO1/2